MRPLPLLLLIAILMSGVTSAQRCQDAPQQMTVHGRLSRCNGFIGTYIWVVGTKRNLGVTESMGEIPDMPDKLLELLGPFEKGRLLYADFTVVPATAYKKGVMQMVRILSATNIVVVEDSKIIIMKKTL